MNRRIFGIVAALLLVPTGIIVFSVGAQNHLAAQFAFGQPRPNLDWLVMLLGAVIVAAGIAAAVWSGIGVAAAGVVGVLLGLLQFLFPVSIGAFNLAAWFARGPGGLLPREAQEAIITFMYIGGPLTVGGLLIGAALGLSARRRRGTGSPLWMVVGIVAVLVGIPLAIAGQSILVYTLRTMKNDPLAAVLLILAAVALATAAYASRGGGLALVISGGVVAAVGLAAVLVPTLVGGPSPVVRLSQENAYVFAQGMPLLFGLLLLATGLVSLLIGRRRQDAVPATPV